MREEKKKEGFWYGLGSTFREASENIKKDIINPFMDYVHAFKDGAGWNEPEEAQPYQLTEEERQREEERENRKYFAFNPARTGLTSFLLGRNRR